MNPFKKLSFYEDIIPSFSKREMLTLSGLLLLGGLLFYQSFQSYQKEFNHTLDDIFIVSNLHNSYKHAAENSVQEKDLYQKLRTEYLDLIEDIEELPTAKNHFPLLYKLESTYINRNDNIINQLVATYRTEMDAKNISSIKYFDAQPILSDLYEQVRKKQQDYVLTTNYYRTTTYFILLVIVIFISHILIKHYAKERHRAVTSSQTKSEFLANMSHEIRTPLNGIIGMTELMKSTMLDEVQKQYLHSLTISAEGLNELINDILDISKIESGRVEIESIPINLKKIIDDTFIQFQTKAQEKNVKLIKDIESNLHLSYIGDPTRIKQILINLISNALKFTHTGHVRIIARPCRKDNQNIYIEVQDTGIGIPEHKRESMFKKFSQAENTTTRKYGGTGLGLAICKNLIEHMHGEINYHSNEFGGTTFWFTLGLPRTDFTYEETQVESHYREGTKIDATVILAEDNKVNQQYAIKILKDMGITVLLAETGVSVIQQFKNNIGNIDLILMDCRMPEMDGYTATEVIRRHEQDNGLKVTPIVALTANAIKGDIEKCMECGMDDYLAKPIRRNILEDGVTKWLQPHSIDTPPARATSNTIEILLENIIDAEVFEEMRSIMGTDMDNMVHQYISTTHIYIKKISDGISLENFETIADAAHTLKSSSASLGAISIHSFCKNIEELAKDGTDIVSIKELFEKLTAYIEETNETLLKRLA